MRYECFSVAGDYLGPFEVDRSIEITEGKFISTEELRDESYVHWEVIAVSQEDGGFRYVVLDPAG